ncbi:phage tail fiber protein [Escherichia coli]|nr:phage tail fiber protein [Escherichia coli]
MLTHSGDGGAPLGAGRGFVMTAEGPTLTGFNSAYRTSSTSDTVSMITVGGLLVSNFIQGDLYGRICL